MLAPQALLLLAALAQSALAGVDGQRTVALNVRTKRAEPEPRTHEELMSKLQWAKDEAIRVGLKHPLLFTEEGQAEIRQKAASWRKRSMEAPMKNWGTSYSVEVGIGTPPQTFDSMLDTGSGDFWVVERCTNQTECGMSKPFDETKSSTFKGTNEPYSIQYMKGETSGYWVQDMVSIGEQSNLTWFGAADVVTEWGTSQSGLMGFSFQGGSTGHQPWWMQVISGWERPMFSLYLGRTADDESAYRNPVANNSQVILGGVDTSKYSGDINFVNVQSAYSQNVYWECPMDSVKVHGKVVPFGTLSSSGFGFKRQFGGGGTQTLDPNQPVPTNSGPVPVPLNLPAGVRSAVIDSGTTLVYGPQKDTDALYSAISGAFSWQGQYFFPQPAQGQSLGVSFTFGGVDYPIYDGDLVWQCATAAEWGMGSRVGSSRTTYCQGTIQAQSSGATDWLVGGAFMKNVYTVFRNDPQSIGFAPLSQAANIYYGTPWLPATSGGGNSSSSGGSNPSSGGGSGSNGGGGGVGFSPNAADRRTVVSAGAILAGVIVSISVL